MCLKLDIHLFAHNLIVRNNFYFVKLKYIIRRKLAFLHMFVIVYDPLRELALIVVAQRSTSNIEVDIKQEAFVLEIVKMLKLKYRSIIFLTLKGV